LSNYGCPNFDNNPNESIKTLLKPIHFEHITGSYYDDIVFACEKNSYYSNSTVSSYFHDSRVTFNYLDFLGRVINYFNKTLNYN
jgi:hypothetical protein